jgi:dipeptidyl aminopeptidase/acylaminoacyl peptidase
LGPSLYANDRYDAGLGLEDEWTGRINGASYIGDKFEYTYFDPSREQVQRGIEAAFPGTDAHAVSTSLAGDKMIVRSDAPKRPPTYYFLDRSTHQATKIASEYPALESDDLGEMRSYPYRARDGLAISAYLTLPPGRGSKDLPLIVMPHGGPDARDWLRFDWWVQFLANRGYAVFQPNFRGSKGYGRAFTDAGLHQWGLKMQDDITDGVKKLIADGVADPKRICIVGASYGGYAALAGATFTPDLYSCAVSFAGIGDLDRMLAWWGARRGTINTSDASFWISRVGDPSEDADRIAATSPALHADQVKIPILLMHGANDTTVPIEQSEIERDALERAGKKVEFVKFDTDDHYFSLAATRIGMLTELQKFLHDNIGG